MATHSDETVDDLASRYMHNTSSIPIFAEDLDSQRSNYPAFFDKVWDKSMEAVLNPGDMLVMPPGWWHGMRGEGDGPAWSVSIWY
jgi:hypothetical protein